VCPSVDDASPRTPSRFGRGIRLMSAVRRRGWHPGAAAAVGGLSSATCEQCASCLSDGDVISSVTNVFIYSFLFSIFIDVARIVCGAGSR